MCIFFFVVRTVYVGYMASEFCRRKHDKSGNRDLSAAPTLADIQVCGPTYRVHCKLSYRFRSLRGSYKKNESVSM
jgi:hypothetical protein